MQYHNMPRNIRVEAQDDMPNSKDSGFGDSAGLSTTSLGSDAFDYDVESGRSFHAYHRGKYLLPNDSREQERMDTQYQSLHHVLRRKHWLAPIGSFTQILDVGTGTGIWALDVADCFPSSQVKGIDLSPIQPTSVPPNLTFEIMDADETWEGFEQRFDFVHTRLMNGFSIRSWPFFYEQAFASLEPGGWVENQEIDIHFACDDETLPGASAYVQWAHLWNAGIAKFGLTGRCYPRQMKQQMEDAGFINIRVESFRMPVGPWAEEEHLREAGQLNQMGLYEGLSGFSQKAFTQGLGWSMEKMEAFLVKVRQECRDSCRHNYFPT